MIRLKQYGFFKELKHGDENGTSLKSIINEAPAINEVEQINYLKKGIIFIACLGTVKDILNNSNDIIGSPHILTDGVWAWPADLAYYVENYHVRLPYDFIQHMKENKWDVPSEDNININELEL